ASVKNNRLPGSDTPSIVSSSFLSDAHPLDNILPFLEPGDPAPYRKLVKSGIIRPLIKTYLSPTDPTIPDLYPVYVRNGPTSYVVNMQAFMGSPSLASTFTDGTANTIAVSQRYARCGNRSNDALYTFIYPADGIAPRDYIGMRSGTFA